MSEAGGVPDGVYLLSSAADTVISRLIRFGTGGEHGHLAVVFAEDGQLKAYSFARRRWSTPLDGAFVEEGRERYTMAGGRCSSLALFRLPPPVQRLTRERLRRLRPQLEGCLYNLPDAVASAVGLRVRSREAYTCVAFCALALGLDQRREVISLRDVLRASGAKMVYRGSLAGLEEFAGARFWDGDSDFYSRRLAKARAVATVVASQSRAIGRIARERVSG
ncbi:MAG: hypothetical protein LBD70_08535 [Bifidobacteriaceae bacterium]|jgi:hypothetical protein|nr:hypothetical protein [Bifidobacteriaceae bacterium]